MNHLKHRRYKNIPKKQLKQYTEKQNSKGSKGKE